MANELPEVEMFTDGACSGNPGTGGYAAILRFKGRERVLSGGSAETTNNKMELTAVVEGFRALKRPCSVTLYTDSKYVADGLGKGWAESWKRRGWKRGGGKPALNPELWDELLKLTGSHRLRIVWVRGHAGHPENERCDALAVEESRKFADCGGARRNE